MYPKGSPRAPPVGSVAFGSLACHRHLTGLLGFPRDEGLELNRKRLKFLKEFENQVPQLHPERLVVVADDVRRVLLYLNEGFRLLQQHDVSLCRVLHLHVTETMLRMRHWRERHTHIRMLLPFKKRHQIHNSTDALSEHLRSVPKSCCQAR